MTNYKLRYTRLLQAMEETLGQEQAKAISRRAYVAEEHQDFMKRVLPFSGEQMDALWGDAPMTKQLLKDILFACVHWSQVDAFEAVYRRFSYLAKSPDKEMADALRVPPQEDHRIQSILQDVMSLWQDMK